MKEDLLSFIWQFQYYENKLLRTTEDEPVEIYNVGYRNQNAGPDFLNAKIRIGKLEWIGNVEIHIKSSDWHNHAHQENRAYDNVVLHVVWSDDIRIMRPDGTFLPTITLKERISEHLLERYRLLMANKDLIPCASSLKKVSALKIQSMIDKAGTIRIEQRAGEIISMLRSNKNDWELVAYQMLARNFGFKVNKDAFARLAEVLPLRILQKHRESLFQTEALMFGQAGFLDEEYDDTYFITLKNEYTYLSYKYGLEPSKMKRAEWKFARVRPSGFPTVRIAQFASIISNQQYLIPAFTTIKSHKHVWEVLSYNQSEYWRYHYRFGEPADTKVPYLGNESIENIIINTVVPLLAAYSIDKDKHSYLDKAVSLLEKILPEDNQIIRAWLDLGIKPRNSFESQALIELHNQFCLKKRCMECVIGTSLLQ